MQNIQTMDYKYSLTDDTMYVLVPEAGALGNFHEVLPVSHSLMQLKLIFFVTT